MTGIIKKLTDKNFDFIAQEEGGDDLFFHASSLVGVDWNDLKEGDKVTFDVTDTEKGKAAANVAKA